jgi:serine/threonine-protein phosphatase 2B regulatory subunit
MPVIGRLFITCQNVTLNSLSQVLLPQLFVRLDNHESLSRAEADKVITIDLLSQPEDLDLFIELRDDTSGESIGRAKYNIADVLRSGQETCITLEFSSPDDKTVVSAMNFKLAFVQAKTGSIKLRLGAENSNDDTRVVLSLPDGQSTTLVDQEVSFSVDHEICFWDITVQVYKRHASIGYGKLSLLSCLQHGTSIIPIKVGDDTQQTYKIAIDHWFVKAQNDDLVQKNEDAVISVDEDCFTDNAIKTAFNFFDLDKNGYIGVAELKHILIMMGEIVSDEELDMMISMLDINGDGQVGFQVRRHSDILHYFPAHH